MPPNIKPYDLKHIGLSKATKAGATRKDLNQHARWNPDTHMFQSNYDVRNSQESIQGMIAQKTTSVNDASRLPAGPLNNSH
ncbi:MAG: hypothetical protein EZS28_036814 [Streblomastix strix]|uniref:Uncharacterized protein n=1 Tax=Streblomastix strix TaxID=222440 RepID=A0A5J4UB25_9EUKA|nr:MAG: hypothetical protein EZS28_036814 [Streblomastix strix]